MRQSFVGLAATPAIGFGSRGLRHYTATHHARGSRPLIGGCSSGLLGLWDGGRILIPSACEHNVMIQRSLVVAASVASLAVAVSAAGQSAPTAPTAPTAPAEAPPASTAPVEAPPTPSSAAPVKTEPSRPTEVGTGAVRTPTIVKRVGGNRDVSIEVVEGVYRFKQAMIESPLPVGYPEPTPFGAIDIKEYPSVRCAELTSKDESGTGMTAAFFPLFNHIKKREIAMTAPVEMDYRGLYTDFMKDEPAKEGETTMSFLYRSSTLGPVGEDGKIVVRDTAPVTVLSIGARGAFDAAAEFDALRTWLKSQAEWEVAGDPRMFVYNGPFVDPDWRWSEVQVPVRRRSETSKDAPDSPKKAGS